MRLPATSSRQSGAHLTRRTLLGAAGASVIGAPASAWAQSSDALQDWLRANAIPVRAEDDDFSDLEPLAPAIGDARVVQLGEPSHNAGTCFAAKARLVRFLHRRMGFDVVVWECGLFHVELVEAALRAGEDVSAAARRGLMENWAVSAEVRPLLEYAQASHASGHPLTMAGFDMTPTGAFSDLATALRVYCGGVDDAALRTEALAAADEVTAAFGAVNAYLETRNAYGAAIRAMPPEDRAEAAAAWGRDIGAALRPRREMLPRLDAAVGRLTALLDAHAYQFAGIEGETRRGFWMHVLPGVAERGVDLYESFGADVEDAPGAAVANENRRDALNAENLRFLIDRAYAGRKLIVWAHNAHVMNAYYLGPDFTQISLDAAPDAMKPHGVYLAERYGCGVYTIGFTAYEGEDGWAGLQAAPIPPASPDSIEERLNRLGLRQAFVDLRGARGVADHPLRGSHAVRLPKYDEVRTDPAGPYDALFFIARMERGTLIA